MSVATLLPSPVVPSLRLPVEASSNSRHSEGCYPSEGPSRNSRCLTSRKDRSRRALLLRASKPLLQKNVVLREQRPSRQQQPERSSDRSFEEGHTLEHCGSDPLPLHAKEELENLAEHQRFLFSPLESAWSAVESVAKLVSLAQTVSLPRYVDWPKLNWMRNPEVGDDPRATSASLLQDNDEPTARCSWPREVSVGVVASPRCNWPRNRASAATSSVGAVSAGSTVESDRVGTPPPIEGARCVWPKAGATAESLQEVNVDNVPMKTPSEDVDRLERIYADTPVSVGAHCKWPRKDTPQGAYCAWPRVTVATVAAPLGAHCAWPRAAPAATGQTISAAAMPSAVMPTTTPGPRCPWPRAASKTEMAQPDEMEERAMGPRCAWPKGTVGR